MARRQDHWTHQFKQWQASHQAPVLKPDPRVDELMRIVSTIRGGEALKNSIGVK